MPSGLVSRPWPCPWSTAASAATGRRIAHALEEEDFEETRHALGGDRGFVVHQAVRVELPIGEVYRFWRRFDDLPGFVQHLAKVTELDRRRSHWVARRPGGVRIE